ncbi:hypothetical protein RHMOL_Rhmol02G0216000 [Rhododendron molle]|uniref:Uncharacterized protein n=1 Tax=Rhododendron molle TaxID=49168 RepID=A0ACC0PSD2_RHOML|nr:hypothetical protein RHMOL_Rhmol02G0216000 [Rhododendron molle]
MALAIYFDESTKEAAQAMDAQVMDRHADVVYGPWKVFIDGLAKTGEVAELLAPAKRADGNPQQLPAAP